MTVCFTDYSELEQFIREKDDGFILVEYRNLPDYDGMVLYLAIHFNIKGQYKLALEWSSFGLDLFGDTLQESYIYQFENLSTLIKYLEATYSIHVTDIPKKYKYNPDLFSSPLKDEHKKPLYEEAWQRFQKDFRNGIFLDPTLTLVYSSLNR